MPNVSAINYLSHEKRVCQLRNKLQDSPVISFRHVQKVQLILTSAGSGSGTGSRSKLGDKSDNPHRSNVSPTAATT